MCALSKKEHCIVLPHSCLVGSREPEARSFPHAIFIAMDFCYPDNFLPLRNEDPLVNQFQFCKTKLLSELFDVIVKKGRTFYTDFSIYPCCTINCIIFPLSYIYFTFKKYLKLALQCL